MCYRNNYFVLKMVFYDILNNLICLQVYVCGSFVQQNDFAVLKKSSDNANELSLTRREVISVSDHLAI